MSAPSPRLPSSARRWSRSCSPMRSSRSSAAIRSLTSKPRSTGGRRRSRRECQCPGRNGSDAQADRALRGSRIACHCRAGHRLRRLAPDADRRHDRHDVRGAGHRPGRHASRRASACLRHRSQHRQARRRTAGARQSGIRRARRRPNRGRGLFECPRLQRHRRAAGEGRRQRRRSPRRRAHDRGDGSAGPRAAARNRSPGWTALSGSPARYQARLDRSQGSQVAARRSLVMALRVVFFGTPVFAIPTLSALLDSSHEVVAVVTQPDRPRGRGQRVSPSPVKAIAMERALPIFQPERLRDPVLLDAIRALAPDVGIVAAYGRLLPQALLDVPSRGMLNVHASLLPRWRGAAPVHRAILAGDATTGVTIMRVVLALDAGPMMAALPTAIGPDETSEDLEERLANLGSELMTTTLDRMEADGDLPLTPQDETRVTYAARLERRDGEVNWSRPARDLHNQIRGLHPWPLAAVFLQGRRMLLQKYRSEEHTSE